MSRKRSVCIIVVLLVFTISIYGSPQSTAPYSTAQATPQTSSIQRQADPPSSSTRLIREYLLPVIPPATTAFLGPRRGPYGIVYDDTGYIWVTDFNRDAIYRLTPATTLNQTTTTTSEWLLPNTQGKRCPSYIIVNETRKVVWFTDPTSRQISRLNWSSNKLDDWNLANFAGGVMPLDLVMVNSTVWFTGLNDTRFFKLDVITNLITPYTITIPVAGTPGVPARPTKIATNGTSLYITDWKFDNIYEVRVASPVSALSYNLTANGFSWDIDVDPDDNMWVTQPLSSRINDQLAHSTAKALYQVEPITYPAVPPVQSTAVKNTFDVDIEVTPVTPSAFPGPEKVFKDPLWVWRVPTGVSAVTYVPPAARPWEIAASSDGYAWFTEPIHNHIGVVQPDTNMTLLYEVPTETSWAVCIDIEPSAAAEPYHVWFTEYIGARIGELFNATFTDIRVCPSLPAHYPPPDPGSIRWTPGTEIWFDAPSNGYDAAHHDTGERGATNHLYARVKNMGSSTLTSISVKFYWYHNTSVSISSNYIPLPPSTPSTQRWTLIGTATIASLPAGNSTDVYVEWNISSNMPSSTTVGVQVSVGGDSNLYDNVGYCNFTLTFPTTPLFSLPSIVIGFAAGFVLMAAIALVTRKR
nr:hypothetical protein [Candidatus Njordarchaeum guaymaensis]